MAERELTVDELIATLENLKMEISKYYANRLEGLSDLERKGIRRMAEDRRGKVDKVIELVTIFWN